MNNFRGSHLSEGGYSFLPYSTQLSSPVHHHRTVMLIVLDLESGSLESEARKYGYDMPCDLLLRNGRDEMREVGKTHHEYEALEAKAGRAGRLWI